MVISCFFSNTSLCERIPTVEYNKNWLGNTGYIDRVTVNEEVFQNHPVVKYEDQYGRPAISFVYYVKCDGSDEKKYATTAFKRYADSGKLWVLGGHSSHVKFEPGEFDHALVERLLDSGEASFELNYLLSDKTIHCAARIAGQDSDSITKANMDL